MKAYVTTTSILFALLTVAHIWRMVAEGGDARNPIYFLITAIAAGLCLWGVRLLRRPTV